MTIKVGDLVTDRDSGTKMRITGILIRGKGFREYECFFPDKNGEPAKAWMSGLSLRKNKNQKFGFAK